MIKKKQGFSLTELLIALAIMAIVAIVLVIMFSRFVEFFVSDDEQVLARQRGMDVVKLLEVPVLHVALGIPENIPGDADRSNIFEKTFEVNAVTPTANPPFRSWGSSLLISGTKSDDLRLLYGKPSGVFQRDEDRDAFFVLTEMNLNLTKPLDASIVTVANTTTNAKKTSAWITFPGQSLPMTITAGLDTTTPKAKTYRRSIQTAEYNEKVNAFSEVLYLQARRAWVDSDNVFHLIEVENIDTKGSGPELTLPGVLRIQFEEILDAEGKPRVLKMGLLTRGDTRDTARVKRLQESRPDLVSRWGTTNSEAEYVVDETSIQWRIRNYETE